MTTSNFKFLFQLSGSIACYKACSVISDLVQKGHQAQVVASESALKFVGEATLEGLTGKRVLSQVFEKERMMDHIRLTDKYDIAVLCPASAQKINQLAVGGSADLIGALFLAWEHNLKPYHIFPAMNARMYAHPATQASLKKLAEYGVHVHGTAQGSLACGHTGPGRLLEAEQILNRILPRPCPQNRVLITSGGTREAIDGVRCLTNSSSGLTGAQLAEDFLKNGWDVTLIRASDAKAASSVQRQITFVSTDDLKERLQDELSKNSFDLVIHLAAVSDFKVARIETETGEMLIPARSKIPSDNNLRLVLQKQEKLLPQLKRWSLNKKVKVIGFKLTNEANKSQALSAVKKVLSGGGVDLIIHNDLSKIRISGLNHPWSAHDQQGLKAAGQDIGELAHFIGRWHTAKPFETFTQEANL